MNLKHFLGKYVVVMFKPGAVFLMTRLEGDRLSPMMIKVKVSETQEQQQPITMPFCMGTVENIGTESEPEYVLAYTERDVLGPQGNPARKYKTALAPEIIGHITYAEEQRIAIIGQS